MPSIADRPPSAHLTQMGAGTQQLRPYSAQNELDRLRLGQEYLPRTTVPVSVAGLQPQSTTTTTCVTNTSYDILKPIPSVTAGASTGTSQPSHQSSAGATSNAFTTTAALRAQTPRTNRIEVTGDAVNHTVALSTYTYEPAGGHFIEAVDTYVYRRPMTSNGEYGNFPLRKHQERVVDNLGSEVFSEGGKIIKNGDKIVPLGGPGMAEEKPTLARHGAPAL